MEALCKFSEQTLSKGHFGSPAINAQGHMVRQDSFAAAVERGRVFAACNQSGVTTQAGLNTAPTVVALINPAGSGVTGRLWCLSVGFLVANAAAATVWLCANSNTVAATITATLTTAHRCLKLGGITPAQQGNRISAGLATIALGYAPVGIDIIGVGLTGAITTTPALRAMTRWYNGGVLIQPGTALTVQTSTASGTSSTLGAWMWEECDLISA